MAEVESRMSWANLSEPVEAEDGRPPWEAPPMADEDLTEVDLGIFEVPSKATGEGHLAALTPAEDDGDLWGKLAGLEPEDLPISPQTVAAFDLVGGEAGGALVGSTCEDSGIGDFAATPAEMNQTDAVEEAEAASPWAVPGSPFASEPVAGNPFETHADLFDAAIADVPFAEALAGLSMKDADLVPESEAESSAAAGSDGGSDGEAGVREELAEEPELDAEGEAFYLPPVTMDFASIRAGQSSSYEEAEFITELDPEVAEEWSPEEDGAQPVVTTRRFVSGERGTLDVWNEERADEEERQRQRTEQRLTKQQKRRERVQRVAAALRSSLSSGDRGASGESTSSGRSSSKSPKKAKEALMESTFETIMDPDTPFYIDGDAAENMGIDRDAVTIRSYDRGQSSSSPGDWDVLDAPELGSSLDLSKHASKTVNASRIKPLKGKLRSAATAIRRRLNTASRNREGELGGSLVDDSVREDKTPKPEDDVVIRVTDATTGETYLVSALTGGLVAETETEEAKLRRMSGLGVSGMA